MNWQGLTRELDKWSENGGTASLWWRDDDAGKRSASLDRLLALGHAWKVPLALAVVPDRAGEDLFDAISGAMVRVLQHGCRHVNRAPPNARKCELIAGTDTEEGLAAGLSRLTALFDNLLLPVLVPPWNRIDPALLPRLSDLGYRGLSRYKPRDAVTAAGLHQVNTHVDIIDWSGRSFRGDNDCLETLVAHLRGRRLSAVDAAEPTGILTHHQDHDEPCWAFVERLFGKTRDHPAVQWLGIDEIFFPKRIGAVGDPSPRPSPGGRGG